MRLLFVAPYLPGPLRTRTRGLVRALAARGHVLTVVGLDDGEPADPAPSGGRVVPVRLDRSAARLRALVALPTGQPLGVAYCRAPEFAKTVAGLVASERFDAAHVEHLRAGFVEDALGDLPRVFDAVDCLADLQEQIRDRARSPLARAAAAREARCLRVWEPALCARFDRVAATTPEDTAALAARGVAPAPTAIGNGVDTEAFLPDPDRAEPATVVVSGKWSYLPNDDAARWLLEDVWPRVRAGCADARLIVAGAGPAAWLRRRDGRDGVEVTGRVDDLRPVLSRAALALCPMRIGVGMSNKALEALATGLPVVATARVARSLSAARDAGALLAADDAEGLAAAALSLLTDPAAARERGSAGRRVVESEYRWDAAAAAFEELYRQASGLRPR